MVEFEEELDKHWRVLSWYFFSWLAASGVVITTNADATNDKKTVLMATLGFQWYIDQTTDDLKANGGVFQGPRV